MKKSYWMLLVFIAALYLLPVIFRPLAAPGEFCYAEIAREMAVSGDFTTPRLLGESLLTENPAGYWLTACCLKLFGQTAFAVRLLPVLGAAGAALFLGLWCRRRNYSSETVFNAMFLYLSGSAVWFFGNFASADSLFAMWLTGTFVCFALAVESKTIKEKIIMLLCAGIAMGCGILTKGMTALILPVISVAVYLVWQKKWKDLLLFPWLPVTVSLVTALPRIWPLFKASPDSAGVFIMRHCCEYFSAVTAKSVHMPLWLLILLLFIAFFPAAFPVWSGASKLRKDGWHDLWSSPEVRFSLCASGLSLILLLLSMKFSTFILPCFAPAAMLGAMILDRMDHERGYAKLRQLTTVSSIIFIILGSAALLAGLFYLLWGTGFIPSLPLKVAVWAPFFTTASLGLVISGTVFFIYRRDKLTEPCSYFMLYAATLLICLWFMPVFTASFRMPEYELLEIANKLSSEKIPRPKVIAVSELSSAAAWCFKDSTVRRLDFKKDEKAQGAGLNCTETAKILEASGRKEGFLIILRNRDAEELTRHIPAGKQITTAGDLCAFYYPGNTGNKETK